MQIPPLHIHIAGQLETEIRTSRQVGERMESERELSRRLDVSQATIAKALAVLTEKGLVVRRHGSGTYVASPAPEGGKNRCLGVLLEYDLGSQHSSYFFRHLAQRCRQLIEEKGWMSRLYAGFSDFEDPSSQPTSREFVYDLEQGALAGLIAMAGADKAGSVALAKNHGVPVGGMSKECTHRVVADRGTALKRFVEHALAQGRSRFALLDWKASPELDDEHSIRHAFQEALQAHGIEPVNEWIRGDLHPSLPGSGWEEFREVWTARSEHPDVVIVGDEHLLSDVGQALRGLGIRPEDLSLYGYSTKGNILDPAFPVVLAELDVDSVAAALVKSVMDALETRTTAPTLTMLPHHWSDSSSTPLDTEDSGISAGSAEHSIL